MRRSKRLRCATLSLAAAALLAVAGCSDADADAGSDGSPTSPPPPATVTASLGGAPIKAVGRQACEDVDGTLVIALNDQSAVPKSGYLEAKVDTESGKATWVMIYTYDYQVYSFIERAGAEDDGHVKTTVEGETVTISGKILESRQAPVVASKHFKITATCPGV